MCSRSSSTRKAGCVGFSEEGSAVEMLGAYKPSLSIERLQSTQ